MHSKYQLRCLSILRQFSTKDAPLSSDHWSYLWRLLPETVGFTAGDKDSAKSSAAYIDVVRLIRASLVELCSNFAGSSSVLLPNRPFVLPLLDASGQPASLAFHDSPDSRLHVVTGFIQLLSDDSYASRFALAASAAYENEKSQMDFHSSSQDSDTKLHRVALFRLCTAVFGAAFMTRVIVPFIRAVMDPASATERFNLKTDESSKSSYMFCSCDMLIGSIEACLTLPQNVACDILRDAIAVIDSFSFSTEVMQPNVRGYLCSAFGHLCSFCVGGSCLTAEEGASALQPVLDLVFSTKGLSVECDVGYLAKRLDFACACVQNLHAHCPPSCLPFLSTIVTFASHTSDTVRSAVSSLFSALSSCCSLQAGTTLLLPWVSSFYLQFFTACIHRTAAPQPHPRELALLKATLCSCSLAHPSMIVFFPQICRLLLPMFEDSNSTSNSFGASVVLQPGRLLCSLADVRFDLHPATLSGVMPVLAECSSSGARHVSACAFLVI